MGIHYPVNQNWVNGRCRFPDVGFATTHAILCDNPSTNDKGDHEEADQDSTCEYPLPWKTNRLFAHNPGPMKWHRYMSGDTVRINLSIFLLDPNKVKSPRVDFDYFID